MKMTKRVLAIVLAALMLAAMIPLAVASAAESYTLKVTSSKEGFNFEVIKVADIDTTTGAYSNFIDNNAALETALKDGKTANALTALDAIKWNELNYAPVFTWGDDTTGEQTLTVAPGFYYVRVTKAPTTVKTTNNRLIPVPYYENGEWVTYDKTVDLASKIDIKPEVSKAIVETDGTLTDNTVVAIGDIVDFRLMATVTGAVDNKLDTYSIVDTMEKGITFIDGSVTVKLTKTGVNDRVLGASEFTVVPANDNTDSFRVDLASSVLEDDNFYSYTDVVVDFKGKLNDGAKISPEESGNENSDGLNYRHKGEADVTYIPGNTVYVFTLKIDVLKIDANTKEPLQNLSAEFTLYDKDKKAITVGNTDAKGELSFKGLDAGTYYVQETKAPTGYNLNTNMYEIKLVPVIKADGGKKVLELDLTNGTTNKIEVEDTTSIVPHTGGMGNMIFMVIGGSLILLAGAMLVIVMKKRTK